MVGATGVVINSSPLDEDSGVRLNHQVCLRVFMNRPVRTRPPGGRNALLDPIMARVLRICGREETIIYSSWTEYLDRRVIRISLFTSTIECLPIVPIKSLIQGKAFWQIWIC
jgi:hypothetical protein